MYQKGEFIIYGSKGVCEITDISPLNLGGSSKGRASGIIRTDKDRLYYILCPMNDREGKVFTPVDSEKTVMRRVLTSEEARALIEEIPDIENLWVADERQREQNYREAIGSCDCRELVKVIKTLWVRNQQRLAQGKKTTAMDKKYFKIAEDNLYAELSLSLRIPQEQVKDYITEKVGGAEE